MRNNHIEKLFVFVSAFLMILSLIILPVKTAFADDSQTGQIHSSDCGLAELSLNDGTTRFDLLPQFDPDTNMCKTSVGPDVEAITIVATAKDANAQVAGDTGTVSLSAGDNTFKVTVTAQDGTVKEYGITVTRPEKSAKLMTDPTSPYLTGITIANGSDTYLLEPAFSKDTTDYSVLVPTDVAAVDIEGTPSDGASVSGSGEQILSYGKNTCSLTVSKNGSNQIYRLTITRTAPESGVYQDFNFENKDTYMIIIGYEGDNDNVIIPDKIYDIPVTEIGEDAFCGHWISGAVLPDSITEIGRSAFSNCGNLQNVTFGSSLKKIGDNAFEGCDSIDNMSLPDSLETVGEEAFKDCGSIVNLNVSKHVSKIGRMFIYGCDSLESITVNADNKDFILQDGILFTADLKTLIVCPPQLGNSGDGFSYTIPASVETISAGAFAGNEYLNEVTVPGSVAEIPEVCFEDCKNLGSLNLNEGIVKIDDYAFSDCESIDSITLPATLTSVDGLAFAGCSGLSEILVAGSSVYKSEGGVLYSHDGAVLVAFPGGFWGDGESEAYGKIMAMGKAKVFCYDEYDNTFKIPNAVLEIGRGAFAECALTDIVFGTGLTKIDDHAFYGCSVLGIVEVPNSVSTVGNEAFAECYSLASVTFGSGLEELSPLAFDNCNSLIAIYFLGEKPNVDTSGTDDVFPVSNSHLTLYYPAGKSGYGSPTWLGYPTATFDPNIKYTVTYDYNDDSGKTKTIQVFKGGKAIELNPCSDSEDSFLGWYEDQACTNPWYFGTDMVNTNITLYARWAAEKNAYLDDLCLSDESGNDISLTPEFDPLIYSYTASLGQDQDYFKVTTDADYDGATVYIDGKAGAYKEYDNINPGKTMTLTVLVKAGSQRNSYTVIVTKEISTDNDLKSLTAKSGGNELCFDADFDADLQDYNLTLDENTSSVTIYAEKDDLSAKVYFDGRAKSSKKYKLTHPGDTATCVITVISQSKDDKTYTVNITRAPDTDAYLSSIKTNLNKYRLNPAFDKEKDSYEVYLPENTGSVILYAKAEGYNASILMTNTQTLENSSKGMLKVNVANGEYAEIDIGVTAQDGVTTSDYTVKVYRAAKVTKFSAAPKAGSTPALSPGGGNELTFTWAQAGDGTVMIEAYVKGDSGWEWESIYSDDFSEGTYNYNWNGEMNGEYLEAGKYKVRISVSYDSDDEDQPIISAYKVINIKILAAPTITLNVSPASITEGGDQSTKITVRWNVLSLLKVEIYCGDELITTLWDTGTYHTAGMMSLYWNGTDDDENAVDPGTYTIKVSAADETKEAYVTVDAAEEY